MTETQKRIKELREAILIKVEDRKAEVSYTEELIDALIAKVKEVQREADALICESLEIPGTLPKLEYVGAWTQKIRCAEAIRGTG